MADVDASPANLTSAMPSEEAIKLVERASPLFKTGETVLLFEQSGDCYDSQVIKVLCGKPDEGWFYFIHYSGWNAKWDRWFPESALEKHPKLENPSANSATIKSAIDVVKAERRKRKLDESKLKSSSASASRSRSSECEGICRSKDLRSVSHECE